MIEAIEDIKAAKQLSEQVIDESSAEEININKEKSIWLKKIILTLILARVTIVLASSSTAINIEKILILIITCI